jgi:hypothetical protein
LLGRLVGAAFHGDIDYAQLLDHELLRHFANVSADLPHDQLLNHLVHHHVFLDHLVTHYKSVSFVENHLKDREQVVYYGAIVHFLDRDGAALEQLEIRQISA